MNNFSLPVHEILDCLRKHKWTLGFAESCTGGLMSAAVTQEAGVSDVFIGSVIAYSNIIKEKILQVPSVILQKEGAVSETVAMEMARGACKNLGVDVSVAITGVAGPTGGTLQKPVGFVCVAVCGPNFESSGSHHFLGNRNEIQKASVAKALEILLEILKEKRNP